MAMRGETADVIRSRDVNPLGAAGGDGEEQKIRDAIAKNPQLAQAIMEARDAAVAYHNAKKVALQDGTIASDEAETIAPLAENSIGLNNLIKEDFAGAGVIVEPFLAASGETLRTPAAVSLESLGEMALQSLGTKLGGNKKTR